MRNVGRVIERDLMEAACVRGACCGIKVGTQNKEASDSKDLERH